jgi:hypothetical protein
MGRMSEIAMEIEDRLSHGEEPKSIAQSLNVPVEWIFNFENDSAEYEAWAQQQAEASEFESWLQEHNK